MSAQSPKTGGASRHQKQAIVISFMGEEKKCDDRTSRCQESHMKNKIKSFVPGEKKKIWKEL